MKTMKFLSWIIVFLIPAIIFLLLIIHVISIIDYIPKETKDFITKNHPFYVPFWSMSISVIMLCVPYFIGVNKWFKNKWEDIEYGKK